MKEPCERDKDGNPVFELAGKKKVRISKFKGQVLIDIREYYQGPNGEDLPGKKGISLNSEAWDALKELIPSIDG